MKKLITLTLITSSFLNADTLLLRSGAHFDGTFLGSDTRQMKFESQNQIAVYSLSDVDSIHFTSGTSVSSVPSTNYQPPSTGHPGLQIMANTPITVRLMDPIDPRTAKPGQTYRASVDTPVYNENRLAIAAYSSALVRLVDHASAGKMTGHTALTLALVEITANGKSYGVSTTDVVEASNGRGSGTAKITAGTAAVGTLLGAIAGGGKGAAIGAGSGTAAGAAASVLRPGQKVSLPSETRLTFRLASPLSLP